MAFLEFWGKATWYAENKELDKWASSFLPPWFISERFNAKSGFKNVNVVHAKGW